MKRLKSYFFTNSNLNSRGKYISLKDNAEPNETLFNDLLDSVVKPKVGADYQDQADFNAVNTKDSSKFVTAENLPEVDTTGSLLTITTTAAVDTNLLRRKKYTVSANIPTIIDDIHPTRVSTKLVTPANLPKFVLDNSEYTQVDSQVPYFAPSIVTTVDNVNLFQTYNLKLRALESTMMTHAGVRLDTVLDGLRTDVNACVSDSELTSAVNSLNLAINNKATKVSPNFVAGYNGTKVTVNSQGIVTTVTKASASDITNDSSVSGSTVKDALNWLKANGGGTGGASDTDGVTNLSDVPGGTATDALNNLLDSLSHYFVKDVVGKTNGDALEVDKINVLTLSSDTSFTLPTPSLAYKGKVLIIVQGNGGVNRAEIFGGLQGSVIISDLSDVLIYNCVYDIGGGGNWVLISRDDSKMCQIPVIVESSTHYASANENIKADALSFGANQSVVIPASNSEGRMIYVYYPTGAPTAFVVNLTGGYTATLNQGDWFLLRDNGSFWEAIGTSQNTVDLSPYATIDSPTFTGIPAGPTASPGTNTTQLATTAFVTTALSSFVGGATYQSTWNASTNTPTLASGVGTKGYYYVVSVDGSTNLDGVTDWKVGDWAIYNGTAWQKVDNTDAISSFNGSLGAITYTPTGTANRVTITGASGLTPIFDIASTYAGQTSITTLGTIASGTWQGTAIADAYIASAATWNAKLGTSGGTLTGALNYAPSVTVPSAGTTDIGNANSNNIVISGTTTITSFGTCSEGIVRYIRFTGALTLTHNATSLILPNSSNITTQTNDTAIFRSLGSGNWMCISYKSVTALTTNTIPYFDGTKFVNGGITDNGSGNIIIGGNALLSSPSFGWSDLSSSLPSMTGSNARFTVLRSNSARNLSLFSNLGAGQFIFLNSGWGSKWSSGINSGSFLTYPDGTQIGGGNTPIYTSVIPQGGGCIRVFITPEASPNSDYIEAYIFINGSNNVASIVKVKPANNTSLFDINISANKVLTSGTLAVNIIYEGVSPLRFDNASNIKETMWRYSANLTSVAIGSSTPNSSAQLDLQSTTKGLGLNLVAGDLGTTRNGLMWHDITANLFKGVQNNSVVTFATTLNTNLTVQFGWKYTYTANTSLFQMLNDTGSTKWIAVDACSIYALTLNFGTAPTLAYQVFYNKNGTGWTSFNTTDTAANTFDVSIKPSSAITLAPNDTIQFRLNQGADGVSMNVIIKS